MADVSETNGWTLVMRWLARILALVVMGLFTWFIIDLGPSVLESTSWLSAQGIPLLIGVVAGVAGVILAWRWELVGGIMAVGGSVLTMILVCAGSGTDMLMCAFFFSLPILLAGTLYLACCYRTRVAQEA
ncbi:MAG: hypothetical protein PVG11_00865 [Anaerolineae bacterium]|jgi:hypothetical protein